MTIQVKNILETDKTKFQTKLGQEVTIMQQKQGILISLQHAIASAGAGTTVQLSALLIYDEPEPEPPEEP